MNIVTANLNEWKVIASWFGKVTTVHGPTDLQSCIQFVKENN